MSSARYRLTCRLASPPVEPVATEGALRRAFAFTETQLENLMQGGRLVATGLDVARAEGMRQRLEALGVETVLEVEEDVPTAAAPAAFPTPPPAETGPVDRSAASADDFPPRAAAAPREEATTVTCPRCKAIQRRSATCVSCGVVFAKLGDRVEAEATPAGVPPRAAAPGVVRRTSAPSPSSTAPMLSLAASAACAVLAAVGSLGCLVSLRNVGSPGSDSAMVAAAGAGTLALWFALRAARDAVRPQHERALRIGAGTAGGVGAVSIALVLVILAGGLRPPPEPPDGRVAALRAAARARWRPPASPGSGLSATRGAGSQELRYPGRTDREEVQAELSRLGTRGVERAEALLLLSRSSLEGVSCRYTEPEPAWSVEGQMVYRLVYRCDCYEGGQRLAGVVTLGVSFLWRDGRWIDGWASGSPTETDAVSLFPAP